MAAVNALAALEGLETRSLRVVSQPPPLPVSLRLESEPWIQLPKQLVLDLRLRLTNHESRGDLLDSGVGGGSRMRELIDDYGYGIQSGENWWVITVWPEGSRPGPIAWCLLIPDERRLDSLRCAFYVDPCWRKRGIGAMLANEATRVAHRRGYSRLAASPWNQRSLSFFQSAGFDILATHASGFGGFAEINITGCPPRLPWRCRPPEAA
jgi:GNAT superfamily N-acetyltransferase